MRRSTLMSAAAAAILAVSSTFGLAQQPGPSLATAAKAALGATRLSPSKQQKRLDSFLRSYTGGYSKAGWSVAQDRRNARKARNVKRSRRARR